MITEFGLNLCAFADEIESIFRFNVKTREKHEVFWR